MSERRIYVYKCVVDDGGAPCVDDGLLTLTICKPYVRRTARKGDLIFAFGSNRNETPPNRLVYIAEVSRRLPEGKYFEGDEYKRRQDFIYERLSDGRLERRKNARFHWLPQARISDLGDEPNYPKANALIADDFRYFGKSGNDDGNQSPAGLRNWWNAWTGMYRFSVNVTFSVGGQVTNPICFC